MASGPARLTAMVALALSFTTVPASAGTGPAPVADTVMDQLSGRLFPLFDALGRDQAGLTTLTARSGMAAMLRARADRRAACGTDIHCLTQAMLWSDAEAALLAAAVPPRREDGPDALAQAKREIAGVNSIIRTYGLGHVPPYPPIDGAGAIEPQEMQSRLQAAAWLALTPREGSLQAVDPSLDFALALLDGSDRTDAIGFEPLLDGLNAPAATRARSIDWTRQRYSAMIVTGVGPEVDGMALSPFGKYHIRLAAARYAKGDVPFLILTGGRAHPRTTRFAEAQEMRRALIERYGVPADAILIEPYARHTTTNLRNVTRILMGIGAPLTKNALIVCNPRQSAYIENPAFVERNQRELGYQPGSVGRRLSPTELEFLPSPLSAQVDPRDPLDP